MAPVTSDQLRQLLNAPGLTSGDEQLRIAMGQALNLTFWAMLALSLVTVLLALCVPPTASAQAEVRSVAEPQPDQAQSPRPSLHGGKA